MESIKSFFGWKPAEEQPTCYHIYGFLGCPYFQKAICVGQDLQGEHAKVNVNVSVSERSTWSKDLKDIVEKHQTEANGHKTCPIVLEGCGKQGRVIGGYSDFAELVEKRHKFRSTRCNK